MKDYYRILQVDPQAEQDVIEAAYRRLMRKYHPDVLSPDERGLEDVRRKAQELNEAHEVLGDFRKRREYDDQRAAQLRNPPATVSDETLPSSRSIEVENRFYLVRCSSTQRTFKMLLGRRKGWSGPFVVSGFVLIDDGLSKPATHQHIAGLWDRLAAVFSHKRRIPPPLIREMIPTPEETLQQLFDAACTLSMGEIDWAGQRCPDCSAEIVNPNGTIGTWSRCGTCHRLKCVGNAREKRDGYYSTCPWCGATNKITRSIATGSMEQAILRGEYQETVTQDVPRLSQSQHKTLSGNAES